jgi:hypothetical protein
MRPPEIASPDERAGAGAVVQEDGLCAHNTVNPSGLQVISVNPELKPPLSPDPKTIIRSSLAFLHSGGEVFELCVIGPKLSRSPAWEGVAGGKKPIVAGWFKDHDKAAALAAQIQATGVYVTLNPCQEALLGRANERLVAGVPRTQDKEIVRIMNLLVDLDPGRPAGISSTDAEHEAALKMTQMIRADLKKEGWSDPLVGDSGNGGHLVYPLDLDPSDENIALVKAVLAGLARQYADQLAVRGLNLDLTVFNPSRLIKLYGTVTRKGDNTPDRPHRLAKIISLPETRTPVPLELLKNIAQVDGEQDPLKDKGNDRADGSFDLAAYLNHYHVDVVTVKTHGDALLYLLEQCVFDESHTRKEAYIGQAGDGTLFYGCKHDSCKTRTWKEARQQISGDKKLADFIEGQPRRQTTVDKPSKEPRKHNFSLVSASQLISEPETTTPWVWDEILPQGGMSLVVAKPKFGKTTMAINLSVATSRGDCFLGRQTTKAPVVYLALEEKRGEVIKRLKSLGVDKEPLRFHFGLAPKKGIEEVELLVAETGAGLLVVDTLQKLARVKDLNDYAQVTTTLEPLLAVARQFNCHILLLHHAGKVDRSDGDEVLGSTALLGAVDTAIFLKKRDDRRTFSTIQRYGENIPETVLTLSEDFSLIAQGTLSEAKQRDVCERIKNLLEESPGLTEPEIADRLEVRKMEVCLGVRWGMRQNPPLLRREGEGKRGNPFLFFCSAVPVYICGTAEQNPKTPLTVEYNPRITVPDITPPVKFPGTELQAQDGEPNEENLLTGRVL